MPNLRKAICVACALLPFLLLIPLAGAEQGQIVLPANGRSTVLTLDLNQGDTVDFSWSGNASGEFRIQNFASGLVLVDRFGQIGSGTFQVPTDGTYIFQFRNPNDFSINLQWSINRNPSSPLALVVIAAVVVIAILALVALLFWRRRQPPSREGPRPP